MKHCFLCRWSFGAIQYSSNEESPMVPVLRCYPNGDIQKEKKAVRVCVYYDPDDTTELTARSEDEQ